MVAVKNGANGAGLLPAQIGEHHVPVARELLIPVGGGLSVTHKKKLHVGSSCPSHQLISVLLIFAITR